MIYGVGRGGMYLIVLGTQNAEEEISFEPRSLRAAWTIE